MIEVSFVKRTPIPNTVRIGCEMDNLVEDVHFKVPTIADGQQVYVYWVKNDMGDVALLGEDNVWHITRSVTQMTGYLKAFIRITTGDDAVWNSDVLNVEVADLPNPDEVIPEAFPGALQQAIDVCMAIAASEAGMIAQAWDIDTEYAVDDLVVRDGLFKCIEATSGEWDPDKWIQTTIAAERGSGGGGGGGGAVNSVCGKTGHVTLGATDVGAVGTATFSDYQTQVTGWLNGKVAKNQGEANAGKFLVVGDDGNVTLRAMAVWSGGEY